MGPAFWGSERNFEIEVLVENFVVAVSSLNSTAWPAPRTDLEKDIGVPRKRHTYGMCSRAFVFSGGQERRRKKCDRPLRSELAAAGLKANGMCPPALFLRSIIASPVLCVLERWWIGLAAAYCIIWIGRHC